MNVLYINSESLESTFSGRRLTIYESKVGFVRPSDAFGSDSARMRSLNTAPSEVTDAPLERSRDF